MKKIVECVPNFSEGRDQRIISAIAQAIEKTPGCTLLDVDAGASTNRTVYTFVGEPETVVQGALNSARVARDLIDMRNHHGAHPRIGALDVCPFIPVANVTMEECVQMARDFGRRAAEELGVPVFMYEQAARHDYRRKLQDVRQGEYEGLAQRLKDPRWQPDFGPSELVPSWGATVAGARFFLVAYNINILGTSNQAHRIALNLREAGRGPERPGKFKTVKGIGWFVEEYGLAQVSLNLTNYPATPLHVIFEEVKKEAEQIKVGVAGSEVVGLIPLQAILMAADYYIEKENLFVIEQDQKILLAVQRLGLSSVSPFDPRKKIIEYLVAEPPQEPLGSLSLRGFVEEVAARSSAPGGGSVAAALAAMGAGLGSMVAKLTQGVRKFEDSEMAMRQAISALHQTTRDLIPMIDADTRAFDEYSRALRMPRKTQEEKSARKAMMQKGLKTAVETPLATMRLADGAWEAMLLVARQGNIACKSDVQVGARSLETGIWGAHQNILINLGGISDESFKTRILAEAQSIVQRAALNCRQVLDVLEKR